MWLFIIIYNLLVLFQIDIMYFIFHYSQLKHHIMSSIIYYLLLKSNVCIIFSRNNLVININDGVIILCRLFIQFRLLLYTLRTIV